MLLGMPKPLPIEFIVQTVSTSNALLRASRRLFRPHGLSEAQFNVLHILQDAAGNLTQRELSEILIVDRSNVTGLVDRMETAGWVKRLPVPGDRRAHRLALTASGRKLWKATYPIYEKAARAVVAKLSPAQLKATRSLLAMVEASANEQPAEQTVD